MSEPAFSVVVPAYTDASQLARCLGALAASTFRDFDVLVVDDGSPIPLEPVARRFGFPTLRLEDGPAGPARARNRGAARVRGRRLVFVDADVCVHPETLERFARAFEEHPGATGVFGSYDEAPADAAFLSQYKNLFHHYIHQDSDGPVASFWAGCGALDRLAFLAAGGFDAKAFANPSIEDIELGGRLCAAGHRILLDRRIQCSHLKRWTFAGLVHTDVVRRGIPWIRLMLGAGAVVDTLNVAPAQRAYVALVSAAALAFPLALVWPAAAIFGLALLGLVTFLNRDFYRFFARRRGVGFALAVVPLHWLYFLYSGVCVVVGVGWHLVAPFEGSAPAPIAEEKSGA